MVLGKTEGLVWNDLWAWFNRQELPVQGGLISGLFTALTAAVGLYVLGRQLRSQKNNLTHQLDTQRELLVKQLETQAENTARSNRHNESLRLRKDIYVEVSKITKPAVDGLRRAATYALMYSQQFRAGGAITRALAPTKYSEFGDSYFKAMNETAEVRDTIVRWHIIDPRIIVFQYGIDAHLHDLREAYSRYSAAGAHCMLIKLGEEDLPENREKIEQLDECKMPLFDANARLMNTIEDYQRELQNVTLSELFEGNRAFQREAVNPDHKPITLSESETWITYFKEETSWGKSRKPPQQN